MLVVAGHGETGGLLGRDLQDFGAGLGCGFSPISQPFQELGDSFGHGFLRL